MRKIQDRRNTQVKLDKKMFRLLLAFYEEDLLPFVEELQITHNTSIFLKGVSVVVNEKNSKDIYLVLKQQKYAGWVIFGPTFSFEDLISFLKGVFLAADSRELPANNLQH